MAQGQTFTTLKSFGILSNVSGLNPAAPLVQGPDGTLYGTTQGEGGQVTGTIFKLNSDGTGFTLIKHFSYLEGRISQGGLTLSGSTLYGTASEGGSSGAGTVFKVNVDGTGFTVLKSFADSDGAYPQAGLTLSDSTLYGTTFVGGSSFSGTVFKMNVDGTGFTVLQSFANIDGAHPLAGLTLSGGTLYGTTGHGGDMGFGTVFSISGLEPEIAVEQSALDLLDGGSKDLGSIAVGASSAAITFTILNSGSADLTGLAITKDGANAADFAISAPVSTTVAPAGSTTFTVTFTPGCGARLAALHIASNDGDENPFDITLTGTGVDTTPPVVTRNGPAAVTVECHGTFTDPGATATDICAGALPVTTTGTVDVNTPGVYTLTYSATDPALNTASQTRTVTIADTTPPVVTRIGPATMTIECHTLFTDPGATGNDTCAGALVPSVSGSVDANTPGVYTLTYSATDPASLTATATRTVTVVDTTPPVVTCAASASVSTSGGTCASNVTFSVTATDNCGTANVTCAPVSGSSFALGATTVNCFAEDGHGNTNTCSFTVTIQDDEAPIVATCPPPQTNSANAMCEGAVPDFTVGVAASDNCTMAGSLMIRQSPVAGTMLGVGTHSIRIYVSDAAGNTNSSCAPIFTVRDNTPPTVMCPGPITNSTDLGLCERSMVLPVVAAMDDCGVASITSNAPAAFPVGPTIVTWTVVDVNGNTNTCNQLVVIEDHEAPTLACTPATLPASPGLCGRTNFVLTLAATNDNCGILSVTNDAPPLLPIGATIVTWLVIDVHGNSNTCQQTVTVAEVDLPNITAQPQSVTNQLGASVVLSVTATSCTNFTYQWCKDGAAFPGETAATLTLNATVHADTGDYTAKVCNGAGCVTSAVARITVNRSPIARDNGAAAGGSQLIRIALPKLLNNDTDADGDALTITGVSAMSTNGGSVTLDATHVTYTPQPGFIGTDRFSYMISDGRGGSATANVVVFVADDTLPGQNQLALVPRPGGMLVRFAGIPGRSYVLQRAGMVTGPWGTLTALTAPIHGIMEYLDTAPVSGMGFYRTVSP